MTKLGLFLLLGLFMAVIAVTSGQRFNNNRNNVQQQRRFQAAANRRLSQQFNFGNRGPLRPQNRLQQIRPQPRSNNVRPPQQRPVNPRPKAQVRIQRPVQGPPRPRGNFRNQPPRPNRRWNGRQWGPGK